MFEAKGDRQGEPHPQESLIRRSRLASSCSVENLSGELRGYRGRG